MELIEIKKELELLEHEQKSFLNYFRAKYPAYHNSNIFFRDFHYSVKQYLALKGINTSYSHSEFISSAFSELLIKRNILRKIDKNTMKLNYEEFITGNPVVI